MKKLFFFFLFCLFYLNKTNAQQYNIAILTGPSTVKYWADDVNEPKGSSPVGYALGLDFARNINPQWQIKLGIRYCLWKIPDLIGPFQWPSEHDGNGGYQYDPSLAHYLTAEFTQQKSLQYLSGIRWHSKSEAFRWVADGEFGFSGFMKNKAGISTQLHPTLGLAFGAELSILPNLFLFAQPSARVIFRDIKQEHIPVKRLLSLQIETGARYAF